jgi:hypothetical protein
VKPVPDALGRVNKLELLSLAELGRPRIDVVVNCSGVFRDLFINHRTAIPNSECSQKYKRLDVFTGKGFAMKIAN